MHRIQLFHSREFPGTSLQTHTIRALSNLGMDLPVESLEADPEHPGCDLPALAIDGEIVVSGIEPSVRELELLFDDHLTSDTPCCACHAECDGLHCTPNSTECGCGAMPGKGGSAAKIIGFIILLIILLTTVKILSGQ